MKILDCGLVTLCTNLIKFTLSSIDEDNVNLIFVTDNGSNLIKGFRNDTHLRCVCHCLNLAIEYGLSKSSDELTVNIDSCKKLVAHFKRAGLQKKLDGISLKQQVDTME